ncbi:hypothetical protein PR202_gb03431 [Eleusine coracana subsp. coracana]|uniref:Uncharacterized protein n=1 Tax=Eleusine coracana subsp. coracana TaxID=191504 RepID=A0AAV5E0X5_ELECO|nr:hypothetical protein PR202_gb03431 [Eleusine coracana subsp. coracana]
MGTTSSYPGRTTGASSSSPTPTASSRPSSVVSTTAAPPSASVSVTLASASRSLPSRRYKACGFSSTTKTRSAGRWVHCWLPFPGNVILVPFFHPGFTSIDRISDSGFILLVDDVAGDPHLLGDADVELLQGARQPALHDYRRHCRRCRASAGGGALLIAAVIRPAEPAAVPRRGRRRRLPACARASAAAARRVAVRERRAPEELREDVVGAAAGWLRRRAASEALLPVLVVYRPLAGVAEHLIVDDSCIPISIISRDNGHIAEKIRLKKCRSCLALFKQDRITEAAITYVVRLGDLLEPGLGVRLAGGVLVGMPPHRKPPVSPAEVILVGAPFNVQDLIVVG